MVKKGDHKNTMDIKKILAATDHTLLSPTATWEEIVQILDDAMTFRCASACIPASYVEDAADYVDDVFPDLYGAASLGNADKKLPICTVIGFPNGYDTTASKMFMADDALENGAGEIDMVINLGWVKDRLWDLIEDEIESIRDVTEDAILKVIIETALLDQKEKIHLCQIVSNSGADFIKTSTGFASGGATFEDVQLMREHVAKHVGVKASGGIRSLEDAERFLALGATRLGTSRLVSLAKEMSS